MSVIFINGSDEYLNKLKEVLPHKSIVKFNGMSRYMHLKNAARGSILISDDPKDKNSPMFAGTCIKTAMEVESSSNWALSRLDIFTGRLSNVLSRVYADPNNIIIGDPEGLDPKKYIDIFPDNWWGSCSYLTEYDPKKLFTILEMYLYYTKPIAVTDKAYEALSRAGLDFVDARGYTLDRQGGLQFRESTRRSESFDFLLEERTIES